MGCDIHLHVESRNSRSKWVSVDRWTKDDSGDLEVKFDDRFYTARNYDLFAILANVRNGYGFGGYKTSEGFVPIVMPNKGLPVNCDTKIRSESERWGVDGHSHSYYTVDEILTYDWTQIVTQTGIVNATTFAYWDRVKIWNPCPDDYCVSIMGDNVSLISEKEMRKRIKALSDKYGCQDQEKIKTELNNMYCRITWKETYAECCKEFWHRLVPRLLRLGKPKDVRIVFWFDN